MFESIAAFWAEYGNVLTDGVWDTLVMVVISTAFAYLIGLPLGVALILTQPHGIRPHRGVYRVLDWIVNIGRSVPFIILMVAIMPFTRMVVGTTIGVKGAIVPLVVSAAPFIARMVETSLNEVDAGVVEAAQSMGASTLQIVWKVYLPEAKPSLILGGAISLVTILAYTAIAGTVGAGLNPTTDALAIESSDSPYVNVLVVKEGNENNEAIQALVDALHSDTIRDYITETFDGAVVPAF